METNKKIFTNIYDELEKTENELGKKSARMSLYRAISFLGGFVLLLIGLSDGVFAAGVIGVTLLIFFVALIKLHEIINNKLLIIDCKKKATKRYLDRFSDEWKNFNNDGSDLLDKENVVEADLDLFGHASLYQLMSVCHTEEGKKLLASSINNCYETKNLQQINGAVNELADDIEGAVLFEALGIRNEGKKRKANTEKFKEYCFDKEYTSIPVWARVISVLLPVVEISLIVLSILGMLSLGFAIVGFFVLAGFAGQTRKYTDNLIAPICSMSSSLDDYLEMLNVIDESEYDSEILKNLKEGVSGEYGAIVAYKKLKAVGAAYNIEFNPILYMIMNGIFLWNYRLAAIALNWRKKYASGAASCMDIIAEFEKLRSYAVLSIVRETSFGSIADMNDGKVSLSCEDLYHPLISPESVISNSASLNGGITIITGSNMSGKTTFLRTLAINLVLSMMGAPVCGKRFEASRMKIFTSMRVTDDVAGGISTFYAEILRIKTMSEYRKNDEPMICLIDEIFKGTNSADRIVGAREVIKGLAGDKCMTIVSTHDFELCEMQDKLGKTATNYHFEEYYEDDKLKFDYKMKNGRCTTTNAKAILKMAGFEI